MAGPWTAERVEKLTELWAREWSCSRIVGALNVDGFAWLPPISRNGVIGKLHRMGFALPIEEVRRRQGWKHLPADDRAAKREKVRCVQQARAARRREPSPSPPSMPIAPMAMRHAPGATPRPRRLTSLTDLENHMCRFPYEWSCEDPSPDGLTYGYCGAAVAYGGCSWCARHLRLVSA